MCVPPCASFSGLLYSEILVASQRLPPAPFAPREGRERERERERTRNDLLPIFSFLHCMLPFMHIVCLWYFCWNHSIFDPLNFYMFNGSNLYQQMLVHVVLSHVLLRSKSLGHYSPNACHFMFCTLHSQIIWHITSNSNVAKRCIFPVLVFSPITTSPIGRIS